MVETRGTLQRLRAGGGNSAEVPRCGPLIPATAHRRRALVNGSLTYGDMITNHAVKEKLMNAQTPASSVDDESLPIEPGLEQLTSQIENDTERTASSLARLTSASIDKLEALMAEIQEMREFLKAEDERIRREIVNYTQLNQSVALAAAKIQTAVVGPWRSTPQPQPSSGRDRIKRWPGTAR